MFFIGTLHQGLWCGLCKYFGLFVECFVDDEIDMHFVRYNQTYQILIWFFFYFILYLVLKRYNGVGYD